MERLTERSENGTAVYRHPTMEPEGWKANRAAVLERCCKYEDTGLTPEEIMDGRMPTGWIPVDDATPDEGQGVLATDGRYVYLVEYDSDYGYGDMDGITAWMPLPDPYKPEN